MSSQHIIRLVPLSDAEYADFTAQQVFEYARQLVLAGELPSDSAVAMARERLTDLLEDRLRSDGHEFLRANSPQTNTAVGWLWVSPAPAFLGLGHLTTRWLTQITVSEPLRGQGFAHAMLLEVEPHLAAQGVEQIWLRVFDWNTTARRLYESLGYELVTQFPTDAHFRKRVGGQGPNA